MEHLSRVHIAKPGRVGVCIYNIFHGRHPESGIPQVFFSLQSGRSYTRRVSLSPLGTSKKLFSTRTVPLVMYRLCCTFSVFFLIMSYSNSSRAYIFLGEPWKLSFHKHLTSVPTFTPFLPPMEIGRASWEARI